MTGRNTPPMPGGYPPEPGSGQQSTTEGSLYDHDQRPRSPPHIQIEHERNSPGGAAPGSVIGDYELDVNMYPVDPHVPDAFMVDPRTGNGFVPQMGQMENESPHREPPPAQPWDYRDANGPPPPPAEGWQAQGYPSMNPRDAYPPSPYPANQYPQNPPPAPPQTPSVAESMQLLMVNQMMMQQMAAQQMQAVQMSQLLDRRKKTYDGGPRGNGQNRPGGRGGDSGRRKIRRPSRSGTIVVPRGAALHPLVPAVSPVESMMMENWQEVTVLLCIAIVGLIYLVSTRSSGETQKAKEKKKEPSTAEKYLT